jgi:hypothetical protein
MKSYKLVLFFDNLDNFMGTDDQARVTMSVESDSYSHAYLLAQRFCKVLEADRFDLEEVK